MSTWASRLCPKKSLTPKPAAGKGGEESALGSSPLPSSIASPVGVAGSECVGADASAGNGDTAALREEFRAVAEVYNANNVCLLRLPLDCWELTTSFLSYIDVIALAHSCRTLWTVLHQRDSVWRRQLSYFYHDVRDLRGGKLLYTAPLFPESPDRDRMSRHESMEALQRSASQHPRSCKSPRHRPMSAYERFFQERRLYVLDLRRELHFRELADVEDKVTGMFTVALHDGLVETARTATSSLFADPFSPSDAVYSSDSMSPPPFLTNAVDNTHEWSSATPSSPASFAELQARALSVPVLAPPYRRTMSTQTNGTSSGNSPAVLPAAALSTPPLLPQVGEPIISDHNPPLHLRVYALDTAKSGESREMEAAGMRVSAARDDSESFRGGASTTSNLASSVAGMTEEQVMEYVVQLSLVEAQQAAAQIPPPSPDAEAPPQETLKTEDVQDSSAQQKGELYQHRHYRGANPAASLPLSELLAVLDALINNASDQLQHYHVRDCTAEEEPAFLRRLSETLRSAKHRRLHLRSHHRAVRNNGQTTRNRLGRPVDTGSSDHRSFSLSAANAADATAPPQHPPPMNRMLHKFNGVLLEITEREAKMVASKLLGMPDVIGEFVAFPCYDPSLLYQKLYSSTKKSSVLPNAPSSIHGWIAEEKRSAPTPKPAETPSGAETARTPLLKPLPFFTRFFLAPELCSNGYIGLFVVDVVRVLVIVEKEVVTTDSPDWASPSITRGGRLIVHGQGLNAQAYTRDDYNYVPPDTTRRRRSSSLGG